VTTLVSRVRLDAQWAVMHGLPRLALRRRLRSGEQLASFVADPTLRGDPRSVLTKVRDAGPFVPQFAGFFVTARHEQVSQVLRDQRFLAKGPRVVDLPPWLDRLLDASRPDLARPTLPPSMLVTDGEEHDRYRRMVSKAFTPRAIGALRDRAEEIADELLSGFDRRPRGAGADLVEEYAARLPVTIIAEMLGVPVAMREQFLAWGNAIAPGLEIGMSHSSYVAGVRAIEALNDFFDDHLERIRRKPTDDILGRLVAVEEDGRGLTRLELVATAILLLAAGFETTVNLLGNGIRLLVEHPDQLGVLRDDPSLWPNAVEEILRYEAPVQLTARVASEPITLGEKTFDAGDRVVLMLAGANDDPAVFPDARRFDVRRPNAREHVSFGAGSHFCLGASLARLEGEVGLRMLFDRFPDLAFAAPPQRRTTVVLRGWRHLPVELGARAAVPVS
jgi:cytochrome P450